MELRSQTKKQKILISAEAIANNIDLLTEILLKLPAKPLIKFKCVSKQWQSLITNPQFCLSHTRHHHTPYPTPTALLLKDDNSSTSIFEPVSLNHNTVSKVPFFDYLNISPLYIEQSCNGLVLLSTKSYITRCRKQRLEFVYYICNPTTKQFKTLPSPACRFGQYMVPLYMAFDPLKSNHYKVICVCRVKNTDECEIELYSSETDSWRVLNIIFTPPNGLIFSSVVFYNGGVHWYSKGETSIYFDVDRECLNTMPMPTLAQRSYYHKLQYFGESRGCLHLIVTEWKYGLQFDVLEMATDYSGWFVRYHVNLEAVRVKFFDLIWRHENRYKFSILHVSRAQKEEELVVVIFVDDKVISYNVHDRMSKELYVLEDGLIHDYSWSDSFPYFGILTSV